MSEPQNEPPPAEETAPEILEPDSGQPDSTEEQTEFTTPSAPEDSDSTE